MRLFFICTFFVISVFSVENCVLSEEEYALAFEILAKTMDHQTFITEQILKKIEQKEINPGHFLDVGCGSGRITRQLMPYFSKVTIVEPNQKFADAFQGEVDCVFSNIFEEFIPQEPFDFILCSHVLYHVPKKEWQSFVNKMINSLAPGGILAIAMETSGSEFDRFRRRFNEEYLGSLAKEIDVRKMVKGVVYSDHFFESLSRDDLFTLCRFFVLEDCFTPRTYAALSEEERASIEREIRIYVDHSLQENGSFRIDWKQELVFFKR